MRTIAKNSYGLQTSMGAKSFDCVEKLLDRGLVTGSAYLRLAAGEFVGAMDITSTSLDR